MKLADHIDENGYWAGEGGGASGVLPICRATKRVCLAWRSIGVLQGDCWGTLGGAIQRGRTPAESAKIEMQEETGYQGAIDLHPAFVFSSGSFKYHNFVGVVDEEFGFHPPDEHSWETDFIEWHELADIEADIKKRPGDYHPGLIKLFKQSKTLIHQLVDGEVSKKASWKLPRGYQAPAQRPENLKWMWTPKLGPVIFQHGSAIYDDPKLHAEVMFANGLGATNYDSFPRGDMMFNPRTKVLTLYSYGHGDSEQAIDDVVRDVEQTYDLRDWRIETPMARMANVKFAADFDLDAYLSKLAFENDIRDCYRGECFGTLRCKGPNGQTVGYIDYSIYKDPDIFTESGEIAEVIHLKMIETHRDARRRGIATRMIQRLKEDNPGALLNWGGTTPEGSALKKSIDKVAAKKEDGGAEYVEESNGWALFPNEREGFYGLSPIKEMAEGGHKWAGFKVGEEPEPVEGKPAFFITAYNQDAYKNDRYEYSEGAPREGQTTEQIMERYEKETPEDTKARYNRKNEWDQSAAAALSTGQLTPQEAQEKKIEVSPKASEFKPLPYPLYHVTTAASKVQSSGLMSRWEMEMHSGIGLGGGDDKSISFTADLDIAQAIYSAMIEAKRVLTGQFTVQQMMDIATKGTNADRPFITEFIQWAGAYRCHSKWQPGEPYPEDMQAILDGYRIEYNNMFDYKNAEELEAAGKKPVGPGWDHPSLGHTWNRWMRPMTEQEKREIDFDQYKVFCATREHAGGAMNPLFFSTDIEALSKVPESEIQILEYRAAPGAMGTQESALGEWRTYSGKAVIFQGVVPPSE